MVAARLLVAVRLDTVVEPSVDDPDTERLVDVMFEEFRFVVDALVSVALDVVKFVLEIFVEDKLVVVEFVIVPLVVLIDGRDRFVIERLVIVAEVSVAFPPAIFAVVILAVPMFEVVEFEVLAFDVTKLDVEPNRVAIVPLVAVRLVKAAVIALINEV